MFDLRLHKNICSKFPWLIMPNICSAPCRAGAVSCQTHSPTSSSAHPIVVWSPVGICIMAKSPCEYFIKRAWRRWNARATQSFSLFHPWVLPSVFMLTTWHWVVHKRNTPSFGPLCRSMFNLRIPPSYQRCLEAIMSLVIRVVIRVLLCKFCKAVRRTPWTIVRQQGQALSHTSLR